MLVNSSCQKHWNRGDQLISIRQNFVRYMTFYMYTMSLIITDACYASAMTAIDIWPTMCLSDELGHMD